MCAKGLSAAEEPAAHDEMLLVCIGASAGGVEALERLFTEMPDDMGMAFAVVQHLSEEHESLMPQILSRKTEMAVRTISDGQKIERNTVYVLPGGSSVAVENGVLHTYKDATRRHNSIDDFFISAANEFGENAIAVVLSGTGSDGSVGIREIHANNGFVIVQNESSAKFNGMPRSAIATGVADTIVGVEDIPDVLYRFKELYPSSGKSRRNLFVEALSAEKRIQQLLQQQFGIDFDQYKTGMFGRRLSRRMMLCRIASIEDYLTRLQEDQNELRALYCDLLIGVTEFFRDEEAFSNLQHMVLPNLIENALESGELRVWVAPCATGEEAYSLAILIDELIEQRQYKLDVKIFATDVNPECIEFAGKGIYSEDRIKKVSKARIEKYFRNVTNGKQIDSRIRKQIIFATQNVLQDAPFTKLHLISCRNLLIYFQEKAKKKLLSLFNFSLLDAGVLFLGPSETASELESAYKAIDEKWRIYRKIAPVRFSQVDMSIGATLKKPHEKNKAASSNVKDAELLAVYDDLLTEWMPSSILIDDENQLVHIFGDAAKFLKFQSGRPTNELMQLLPPSIRLAVTNGLKRVRIESKQVAFPGLTCMIDNEEQTYSVVIRPVKTGYGQKFLISFKGYEPLGTPHVAPSAAIDVDSQELISAMEEELRETRESLHDSILNLKSANEEMQSTNEELIASNEELQSTNEELHSVNEELFTVNSEHQRKITELTELTDDMDNLLDSLQVDTIYLDRNLRVRKFTLGIAKTFKLLPQDVGRDFASFNHDLKHSDIISRIQEVLDTKQARDEEVENKSGNWYLMRILPYNSRGEVDGVLLTLIDITRIKTTEKQLSELSEIVKSSDDAIFKVSAKGEIRTWNRGARELFLHESGNVIGKNIDVLGLDETSEGVVSTSLEKISCGIPIDHVDLKATRRNGEEFEVQSTISPIYSPDGNLEGASIVLRDITAQRKAQRQIKDEVRRRDHFLAVLSHELRNPAAAISNALSVVRKHVVDDGKISRGIEIIRQQSNQLEKLLDDLLHVSRVTHDKFELQLEIVDVVATAKQVIESVEHRLQAKNQFLSVELPEKPILAMVDRARIVQAQTNILINASKYTPEKGHIRYCLWKEREEFVVEIADDGEGMTGEFMEKVFEVFVQADQQLDRSAGGMGLGLPLVKMIASAHGGSIGVTSDGVGLGSEFRLKIPLGATHDLHEIESHVQVDISVLEDKKVLLVEDNDGAREMLAEFLMAEGMNVVTAGSGSEGVAQYASILPDICVVDIGLPDLNGYDVARNIRQQSHQPVLLVALTGYGQEKDRAAVQSAGFDIHLVKPMDPEKLVKTIVGAFEGNQSEQRSNFRSKTRV